MKSKKPVALDALLRSGAGKHNTTPKDLRTRSSAKRTAINEQREA